MPLRVYCPDCDTPYTVPDQRRNNRIRCRQCDRVYRVGEPNERRPPDRRPTEPNPGQRTLALLAIGGTLLLIGLACGGGLVGWYLLNQPPRADDDPHLEWTDEEDPDGFDDDPWPDPVPE